MADPIADKMDTNSSDVIDVIENIIRSNIYRIYIDKDIDEPFNYRSICNVLNKASEKDIIRLIINTPGGYISSGIEICNYLQRTRAKTIAEVHVAYSAGSMITFHCDEIDVVTYGNMMIHNVSFGEFGKVSDVIARTDFEKDHVKNMTHKTYSNFLSSSEIDNVLLGQDIWLNENQIKQRLKKWKPMRDRKKLFTIRD